MDKIKPRREVRGRKILAALVTSFLVASLGVACTRGAPSQKRPLVSEKSKIGSPARKEKVVVETSQSEVKLYFPDAEAQYLVLEIRKVSVNSAPREALEQLLKGPQKPNLTSTIPAGTRLLGLEIKGGVAYVNFSSELVKKHVGGSAAETMTIYSVVDTMGQFPQVKKVTFLVEGKTVQTINGHYDLTQAFAPRWDLVRSK